MSLLGDRNDPRVRDAVGQVNRARLKLLAHTYRELGLPSDRSTSRARVAYAAILGLLHRHKPLRTLRTPPYSPTKRPQYSCLRDSYPLYSRRKVRLQ